uniref:Uncharacterized protein n=1 Tax=Labrus bergylta TaxID=56723 RepID=A0A3Q3FRS7_9LABR
PLEEAGLHTCQKPSWNTGWDGPAGGGGCAGELDRAWAGAEPGSSAPYWAVTALASVLIFTTVVDVLGTCWSSYG